MTRTVVLFVGGLVALGVFVALWELFRRLVPRRLAVRNLRRRPAEAALVVAGSLLGAALITGSFVVGDTLHASYKETAYTQLGPVDEAVVVSDPRRVSAVYDAIAGLRSERIDGVLSFVAVPASVATHASGSQKRRAEPEARLVELDFTDARSFGDDPAATGIRGETPGVGDVAITGDLASALRVGVGDDVSAFLYGSKLDLEVVRVLPTLGVAGFNDEGLRSTSMNAFVSPGTVAAITRKGMPKGAIPPSTTIAISNRGGVEDGARLTQEVTRIVEDALAPSGDLRVEPLKKDRLDGAETQGQQFSELFLNVGSFAILAGILLLVNIFVMLAEERKGQLGMLRAVGMTRSDLVRLFVIEGSLYALVASALGALLGIFVGWAIVKLAAPIFGGGSEFSLDLKFALTPQSITRGFFIGALISTMTVALTSIRVSRINIIRAIRDLPEPSAAKTRTLALVVGVLVAAVSAALFIVTLHDDDAWAIAVLGPPLVGFGLVPLLRRLIGRRAAVMLVAIAALSWGIFGNALLDGQFFDAGDVVAFVLQGVLLTFAAVILLSNTQENLEQGLHKVAGRSLSLRLGLAYPLARRFRTGLTLGMYALVIFTMTFITVLSNVFGGQIDRATRQEAGGFDMLVTASEANPPEPDAIASFPRVKRVATLVHGDALYLPDGFTEPQPWPITGIDQTFVDVGPPELGEREQRFATDDDVWDELLSDPETAVIDSFFLSRGAGPPAASAALGETMSVIDPVTGKETQRRVIGVSDDDQAFNGVFMSTPSVRNVLSGRVAPNRFYVEADGSPQDLERLATRLQGRFVRNGVEASSFRAIVEEGQRFSVQFLRIMQGYLALGLIVGIAGLGVVMVRAVRERRREIGVLRALGFGAARVRRSFVLESGFQAVEGILVGSILALVTASQLIENGDFGEGIRFVVPWGDVALLGAVALGASLLATAWPAQQAARIAPAVALRIAD